MLFIKCYSVSYMYDALFVKDWRLKKKILLNLKKNEPCFVKNYSKSMWLN